MYKYLTLIDDVKEVLVMMNSLPTCTILFDSNGGLVDMNKLASDFLQISSTEDYLKKRFRINTDYFYLQSVIEELKTGKTISKGKLKFQRQDDSVVCVEFNASMLYGLQKIFIFQFFEISSTEKLDFRLILNSTCHDIVRLQSKITELGNSMLGELNNTQVRITNSENVICSLLNGCIGLTPNEVAMCELITNGLSIKEMSVALNKTQNNIYGTLKRIAYKLNMRSVSDLRRQLKGLAA